MIISLLMNSVSLSVTRISGFGLSKLCYPVFIKRCICKISITVGYKDECYIMCKGVNYDHYI